MELDQQVEGAVKQDAKDKNVRDTKFKALLGDDKCVLLNCPLKDKEKQQDEKIKEMKQQVHALAKDNEILRKSLEKKASDEDRKEAFTLAMKDEYVQVLNEDTKKLRQELGSRDSIIDHLKQSLAELRKERQDFESLLQTDSLVYDKWKQLKLLEERCAQMDAWYREAYQKGLKLHEDFEKKKNELVALERQRDEAKREYAEYKELINHADALMRKGCSVSPPKKHFFRNPFKKHGQP